MSIISMRSCYKLIIIQWSAQTIQLLCKKRSKYNKTMIKAVKAQLAIIWAILTSSIRSGTRLNLIFSRLRNRVKEMLSLHLLSQARLRKRLNNFFLISHKNLIHTAFKPQFLEYRFWKILNSEYSKQIKMNLKSKNCLKLMKVNSNEKLNKNPKVKKGKLRKKN